jgi:disulfide bond formation protein DsbB
VFCLVLRALQVQPQARRAAAPSLVHPRQRFNLHRIMTPFVQSTTNFVSYLTVLADIFAVFLLVVLITPLRKRGWTKKVAVFIGERAIFLSFLATLAALGGSLFYSEIAGFAPCVLCWWQRVFLYPQAILLFIAFIKKDQLIRLHSIVLSSIGMLISIYNVFLQFGGTAILNCDVGGVTCQHIYFLEYGYVTIPTMSLTIFALMLLFMLSPNPSKKEINEL